MELKKLYILVNKKLPKRHYMPQAVHAAMGWCCENPGEHWKGITIVILGVDDICHWANTLSEKRHYVFKEPYWKGLATALASPYIEEEVKDLMLL